MIVCSNTCNEQKLLSGQRDCEGEYARRTIVRWPVMPALPIGDQVLSLMMTLICVISLSKIYTEWSNNILGDIH
jgi:hypothetical protein